MDVRADSIKRVLDILLSTKQITEIEYNNLYARYIDDTGPTLKIREQNGKTNSNNLNDCMIECGIDTSMLFSMLDDTDNKIIRHHKLNEAVIGSLRLELHKNRDKLEVIEKTLKLKQKNVASKVFAEMFRDISSFEKDNSKYTHKQVVFDPGLEAIKLQTTRTDNILLSSTGEHMASMKVIRQHSSGMKLYNKQMDIQNAIDSDTTSYWHESIVVDEPIEIEYTTSYFDIELSSIQYGAVCEVLITLDNISEFNEIYMAPFCEFPLSVVEISYSDNDIDEYQYFRPLVFSSNSIDSINTYLTPKNISRPASYQFNSINAKRIKIIFNQVHYVPNNFITKSENIKTNGIFITENKEDLLNDILGPMNKAILSGTFVIPIEKQRFEADKIQYEYGFYHIALNNNVYNSIGEYISVGETFESGAVVTLETNEEHYIEDGKKLTSIEYELIVEGVTNPIPIIPRDQRFKAEWELLNPIVTNNIAEATTRFEADKSSINSISIYKDEVELGLEGYVIGDNNKIRILDYDPYARYCVSYMLKHPLSDMQYNVGNTSKVIKVRAILRRNSRLYTGISPIIYDYALTVIDENLEDGDQEGLLSLEFIPGSTITIYNGSTIDIEKSGTPVLCELYTTLGKDPLVLSVGDTCDLDEIDLVEVEEWQT